MSRKSPSAQQTTVSPNIIRAWFDTVLNPLIHGLRMEADVLSRGNLTWRFGIWNTASLVPVRSLLMDLVQDNLDQFLTLHPECRPPIAEHDAALESVVESCRRLHRMITSSDELRTTVRELSEAPEELVAVAPIFDVYHNDPLAALAEYIVNGIERLPNYYATAAFWNQHSARFLKLRQHPEIQPSWEDLRQRVGQLAQAIDQLIAVLKDVRNDLSLSAGIPIVERLPL